VDQQTICPLFERCLPAIKLNHMRPITVEDEPDLFCDDQIAHARGNKNLEDLPSTQVCFLENRKENVAACGVGKR
jgi:hypothetical protein